jgi:hypothetical protein
MVVSRLICEILGQQCTQGGKDAITVLFSEKSELYDHSGIVGQRLLVCMIDEYLKVSRECRSLRNQWSDWHR